MNRTEKPHADALGPLPALQMDPSSDEILAHYRALAAERYGRAVTAVGPTWATWP